MCRVVLWLLVLVVSAAAEEAKKEVQKRSGHSVAGLDFQQEHQAVSSSNSESHDQYRHHGEQVLNQETALGEGNHAPKGQHTESVLTRNQLSLNEEGNNQYGVKIFSPESEHRGFYNHLQHHELQSEEKHAGGFQNFHQQQGEQVPQDYGFHSTHGVVEEHKENERYQHLQENFGRYASTAEDQDASKLLRCEHANGNLQSYHNLHDFDHNAQVGGHHILQGHQGVHASSQDQLKGGHTFHRHHEVKTITVTKEVPVPYPVHVTKEVRYPVRVPVDHPVAVPVVKPYPVEVTRLVPYPVKQLVHKPYPVYKKLSYPVKQYELKPYPVHVTRPYPVYVERVVPYPVERVVPLPLKVTIPRPVPYRVPVIRHVPYPVEKHLPVPVKVPVEHPVPVPVEQPYPVVVEQRVPYVLEREVPYPVKVPVHIPLRATEHHHRHPHLPSRHLYVKVHH